jgi:hypothetical protein
MLEYYLITAVVAAGLAGLLTYFWATSKNKRATTEKSKADTGPQQSTPVPNTIPTKAATSVPAPAPAPAPLGLVVPNATHVPLSMVSFLRLFGLAYAPLRDFCFIQGPLTKEQLHPIVSNTLVQMHSEGDAVGSDVMEFLFHGRELKNTEMLSFALLDGRTQAESRIVAFVDKMRFPVKPRAVPT